jgi:DNA transformation protein
VSSPVDPEFISELFASFGLVTVRRMFSGAGVFADGLMIALVVRGAIYLKADAQLIPAFEQEHLEPFSYKTKDGSRTLNSYWRMPERLYDDPDELAAWAKLSMAAARRADAHPRSRGIEPIVEAEEEALNERGQATWASAAATNSGSVSQITRLRPLRLAA